MSSLPDRSRSVEENGASSARDDEPASIPQLSPQDSARIKEITGIQEKKEREVQQKYQSPNEHQLPIAKHVSTSQRGHTLGNELRDREYEAARNIQRIYRGYRTRRHLQGLSLDPAERWTEALKEAQYRNLTEIRQRRPAASSRSSASRAKDQDDDKPTVFFGPNRTTSAARSNWALVGSIARRANLDEESSLSSSSSNGSGGDDDSDVPNATTSPSNTSLASRLQSHPTRSSTMSSQSSLTSKQTNADGPGDAQSVRSSNRGKRKPKTAMTKEEKAKYKQRKLAQKQDRVKSAKAMDLSYFLEMVDVKHRYGSNLRKYHAEWKASPSKQNFFYWLDYGDGKDLVHEKCSRQRLHDMQVRYLSREERRLYEVVVDNSGKLIWRKDGIRVDTTDQWRDSVDGIVRVNDAAPPWADRPAFLRGSSESSGMSSEAEDNHDDIGETREAPSRRVSGQTGRSSMNDKRSNGDEMVDLEKQQSHHGSLVEMLRHPRTFPLTQLHTHDDQNKQEDGKAEASLERQDERDKNGEPAVSSESSLVQASTAKPRLPKKNQKWIFVADTKNNLYISIKQAGAFQHSSFLHGSRVSCAGLIRVRNGQLRILQPRSGHYRTPSHNLHIFIKSLQSRGVDMSPTAVGGSYAAMVGIEGYMKSKAKWQGLKGGVVKRVETLKGANNENATDGNTGGGASKGKDDDEDGRDKAKKKDESGTTTAGSN